MRQSILVTNSFFKLFPLADRFCVLEEDYTNCGKRRLRQAQSDKKPKMETMLRKESKSMLEGQDPPVLQS